MKIVLRGLIEVFQCLAPVHGYKNKPNISNCTDGSLHYGCQSYQLKIYHFSKTRLSCFQKRVDLTFPAICIQLYDRSDRVYIVHRLKSVD